MIDCLKKKGAFVWTDEDGRAFKLIKKKLINVPILTFSNFDKAFKLDCDACEVDIGVALSQEKRYIAFFSEKLNEIR